MSIHFLIVLWAEDEFEAIIQVHLGFFSSMKEVYNDNSYLIWNGELVGRMSLHSSEIRGLCLMK